MSTIWYEVWGNDSLDPPYVLVLRLVEQRYVVTDPKEGNRTAFESQSYDEAKMWLLEDEYVLVRGRMPLDNI
jgi:hypothetical protein